MPGIIRKLVIFAAVDGLVLQPWTQRTQPTSLPSLEINYKTRRVTRTLHAENLEHVDSAQKLEAHGLIGQSHILLS